MTDHISTNIPWHYDSFGRAVDETMTGPGKFPWYGRPYQCLYTPKSNREVEYLDGVYLVRMPSGTWREFEVSS